MRIARLSFSWLFASVMIATPLLSYGESNDDWTSTVAPYVWATGLEGKVATLPPAAPAEIDLSLSDVLDDLDMTLMGLAEARKGRFGLFGEVFYVDITADAKTPGPFYSGAGYEQALWGLSLGGAYAVLQDEAKHIDVVAGLRYWDLDNEIDLEAGAAAAAKRSERESWTDFFVGAKAKPV